MIGQSIGHYKILEKLGAGGMGEVYRAEDTTLERQIALKVLPVELSSDPDRLARFEREAKTLAALDHPNIVTIHTVEEADGIHFLTMQLVEGKRLSELIPKGGMPLERIFEIAIPLADALAAAHEKGVIHRDLKPGNIMVTGEGRVKVLDFGLAKLRQDTEPAEATQFPTEPLTEEGRILGTVPYMSPEQLEGKEIDSRSDIFSLGVILYELATGERPFNGDSSASLIAAIMTGSPQEVEGLRPEVPRHLSRIVRHCLEKEPSRRYQSALDVRNELEDLHREETSQVALPATPEPEPKVSRGKRWWPLVAGVAVVLIAVVALWLRQQISTAPPVESPAESAVSVETQPPMIVVLPFENLGSPEDEYFADGMTEEITSRLAVVRGLRVISRSSAMQYKENRPSLKQVGEELGVEYVLEGSVRWARGDGGSRVRITPQLIRVADDSHLWADSYDRVIEDIFEIQSDIASQVVHQLGVSLLEPERRTVEAIPTDNLEAYQAYLRAQDLSRSQWPSGANQQAIVHLLERSVELDPNFVLAWARIAMFHVEMFVQGDAGSEGSAKARAALDRALQLDAENPVVRRAHGYFSYYVLADADRALTELLLAKESAPNDARLHLRLGQIYRRMGRWLEAVAALQQAVELDPRDSRSWLSLGSTYDALRRFPEAQKSYAQALALAPDLVDAYRKKAWSLLLWKGDLEGAQRTLARCPLPDHFYVVSIRAWLRYYEGNFEEAVEVLENHRFDSELFGGVYEGRRLLGLGCALRRLGRREAAREALEGVLALHEPKMEHPSNPRQWVRDGGFVELSLAYALLGRAEEAIRLAEEAAELLPHDLYEGPTRLAVVAWVSLFTGDESRALTLIEDLLSRTCALSSPYAWAITPAVLQYHPDLDPLRDHPRFQALLEKYG